MLRIPFLMSLHFKCGISLSGRTPQNSSRVISPRIPILLWSSPLSGCRRDSYAVRSNLAASSRLKIEGSRSWSSAGLHGF